MTSESQTYWGRMNRVVRDAFIAAGISALMAVIVNLSSPNGIPFFADAPYDILVPCPEPGGEVQGVTATDSVLLDSRTYFVDARSPKEYSSWRFKEAANLTYDYLDPTPKEKIEALARAIASSRATQVVVYGDGALPDTGEQLGKEISGHGIKNVFYVKKGAEALKALGVEEGK